MEAEGFSSALALDDDLADAAAEEDDDPRAADARAAKAAAAFDPLRSASLNASMEGLGSEVDMVFVSANCIAIR